MKRGQKVKVRVYGGAVVERRVAETTDRLIYVTAEEEYQAARREGREPNAVGFPRDAVLQSAVKFR